MDFSAQEWALLHAFLQRATVQATEIDTFVSLRTKVVVAHQEAVDAERKVVQTPVENG